MSYERRPKPRAALPRCVLDSGGLTALIGGSQRAREWLRWLVEHDGRIQVPTPVLVESTTGDGARDAEVNRVLGIFERAAPYHGKWDGSGVHDWDELEAICARDGYRIKSVTEDPVTGARRVEVERTGVDPKTKAPVTGTIKKTIYPKDLTAAQIDEAGDLALKSAANKEPGTKLDPYGSKTRADGSPADGFFEAVVRVGSPPRSVKIQGWFKETSDGTKVITSHAPAYEKSWPKVTPKDY